jgi:hypothetical protein
VKVVLVDQTPDRKLPFGTGYHDADNPEAAADGNCYNQAGVYTCYVAVAAGEPGAALNVAATINAPYTLLDMFLARGENPNAMRATWHWQTFQPLLTPAQEADQWRSACLQLSRAH